MIKKHKSQIVAQTFFILARIWATLFFIVYFHQNRKHGPDIKNLLRNNLFISKLLATRNRQIYIADGSQGYLRTSVENQ